MGYGVFYFLWINDVQIVGFTSSSLSGTTRRMHLNTSKHLFMGSAVGIFAQSMQKIYIYIYSPLTPYPSSLQ